LAFWSNLYSKPAFLLYSKITAGYSLPTQVSNVESRSPEVWYNLISLQFLNIFVNVCIQYLDLWRVGQLCFMLTFIYLHCQAPPSTFCRGRYRNFVDWLIDWLRLENAAPYDKGGKRENYLSDLCDWWSQNYQLGQLQDANSGNNLISFRNLHLAQRQKVHISDISDTSCMCKIYRHIYIYLHLVDDM